MLALRRLGCVVLLVDWTIKKEQRARIRDGLGAAAFVAVTQAWPSKNRWLNVDLATDCRSTEPLVGAGFLKLTSGSTGEPRGVAVSSEALCADDEGIVKSMGIRPDDRILAAIPLTHSYGFSSIALPALLRGTPIIVPGNGPLSAMKATREHDVTFLPTVPAYVESLVKASRPPSAPSSLRLVITAGAQLKPSAARAFREIYGQPVHVFYGASECGGICFDQSGSAGEEGTLGTPIEGVTVTLAPLPPATIAPYPCPDGGF